MGYKIHTASEKNCETSMRGRVPSCSVVNCTYLDEFHIPRGILTDIFVYYIIGVLLYFTVQQSSFYGFTSMLPSRYTQAVMTGESKSQQLIVNEMNIKKNMFDF